MVASASCKEHERHVIVSPVRKTPKQSRFLTSAVIYGPNAGGKSNLLKALAFMQDFVVTSQQQMQIYEKIEDIAPFLFSRDTKPQPSEFEVLFLENDIRYRYGFSADKDIVYSEWLIAYPEGKPQQWFKRKLILPKKDVYQWSFSQTNFKGGKIELESWKRNTRPNGLFLAAAVQNGNEQLLPVFAWLQKKVLQLPNSFFSTIKQWRGQKIDKQKILDFTSSADPSIRNIKIDTVNVVNHQHFRKMLSKAPLAIREEILRDQANNKAINIKCAHFDDDQQEVQLDIEDESDGTQNMFRMAGPLLSVLEEGSVLFIDELDKSLHPELVREIIALFHNQNINKKSAQLIFSTHDTSLLDKNIFRRDQIWFVEKDSENASKLYPLTDFEVRKDDIFSKNYLRGRYGAIPYFEGGLIRHE